ncbi:tyrosine-protein phosphatase [Streptomyces sp. H27-D2]|uniref:tyrosine-protein phosphatase n=1 Tax=Streptomyces sp. H27-D2 TaxID=3046304 RepID=UPI002DBD471D|nr:tyrosine-protein phosphatase [Streptomyces sp. H27-D2]MEC4020379.1 tyrosine-protein phosphatase [Streptomyces sp. H27-D2]
MRSSRTPATAALVAALLVVTSCAGDTPAAPVTTRQPAAVENVELKGAVNVRDLGGYRTGDGKQLRYGTVFRADALGKLTKADRAEIDGLGLKSVIDFRVPVEVRSDGADKLLQGLTATPLPVDDTGLYERTMAAIVSGDSAKQHKALGGSKAERLMRRIYRNFASEQAARRQFGRVIGEITDGKRLPLLYHCTSGKNRTGWMSYVLLRAVGVPARTAEQDYLLSNDRRRSADRRTRQGLEKAGLMPDSRLIVPLQEVRADYLDAALTEIDKRYGGFEAYLSKGLGLSEGTLAKLRSRLLR